MNLCTLIGFLFVGVLLGMILASACDFFKRWELEEKLKESKK